MGKEVTVFDLGGIKFRFGKKASHRIQEELDTANIGKILVITDEGLLKSGVVQGVLEPLENEYIIFSEVPPDPPAEIIDNALKVFTKENCEGIVAIGGGSVMDVAKGTSLMATNEGIIFDYDNSSTGGKKFKNRGKFLICIPTTSGTGSEVTPYMIITDTKGDRKATIGGEYVRCSVALVDPQLTINLPPSITASTGMDALAHAIGAYTSGRVIDSEGDTSISDVLALKAIKLIAANLRKAYSCGTIYEARSNMLMGSVLGAFASNAGSDAIHGLGHALGGVYHVPHGFACAMVTPYVMEYNLIACPERFADIAVAFGENIDGLSPMEAAKKSVVAVKQLMDEINIPILSDYITDFDKFDLLCEVAEKEKCSIINSRKITIDVAKDLLMKAYNND